MLLKNFVAAYQSLREACANSGPSTSTRCGRVAWRPLSQLTHCGLKTNKPSGVALAAIEPTDPLCLYLAAIEPTDP